MKNKTKVIISAFFEAVGTAVCAILIILIVSTLFFG